MDEIVVTSEIVTWLLVNKFFYCLFLFSTKAAASYKQLDKFIV